MYCATKGCYNQLGISGMDDLETGLCKDCHEKAMSRVVKFEQIGKPCKSCKTEVSPLNWCYLQKYEFQTDKALHREHYLCMECCENKK